MRVVRMDLREAAALRRDEVQAVGRAQEDVVWQCGLFAVEAKAGERAVSPAVRYFRERTPIPAWYQVHRGANDVVVDGVRILPLAALCAEVGIP